MGSPTRPRTCSSTQSVKYWALWLARVGLTRTGVRMASARWAGVMAPARTISLSTTVARRAARSAEETGL